MKSKSKYNKIFLAFLLSLFLIINSTLISASETDDALEKKGLIIVDSFNELLDSSVEDTLFLSNLDFINIDEAKNEIKNFYESNKEEVWFNIGSDIDPIEQKEEIPLYKEITFIDKNGQEIIKYNGEYSQNLFDVSLPSNTEFQSENYFQDTKNMKPGEVFIGKVMTWYTPKEEVFENTSIGSYSEVIGRDVMKEGVIRFSSPLYNGDEFYGVLVLSLDYKHLQKLSKHIDPLSEDLVVSTPYEGNYILVFDTDGNTIIHPKPDNIRGYLGDGKLAGYNELNSTREGNIFNLYRYKESPAYNIVAESNLEGQETYTTSATDVGGRTKVVVSVPIKYSNPKTNYGNIGVFGGIMVSVEFEELGGQNVLESSNIFYFLLITLSLIIIGVAFLGYKRKGPFNSRIGAKILILFLLVSLVPLVFIGAVVLESQEEVLFEKAIENSKQDVILKSEIINEILTDFEEDTIYLSKIKTFDHLLNSKNQDEITKSISRLESDFLEFSKQKKDYYQIRYIDEKGQEIVRVDNDGENSVVISQENLQNKKGRYYFEEALVLNEGELFISQLDLNIERGELENRGTVENPLYVPVIRYATPLHNDQGDIKGIIILNVYADEFLSFIEESKSESKESILVNSEGYYLYNEDPQNEFGFMFDNGKQVQDHHGPLLDLDYNIDEGNIHHKEMGHHLLFKKIFYKEGDYWVLADVVEDDLLLREVNNLRNLMIVVGIFVTIVILILSWMLSNRISRPIEKLEESTSRLEKRDFKTRVDIQTGDELEHLGNAFNQTAEALGRMDEEYKKIDKAKTEFLSITSHELRSPLTPMRGQLQMLMEGYFGNLSPKQKESLDIILRNTERLDKIIVDFLEVSRIEAARLKFEFSNKNLEPYIKRLALEMREFLPEKKIKIITKIEKLPTFEVDPDRVMQVLRNLINNAKKFSPAGGSIMVSAKVSNGNILFSVKDQGIGMSIKEQQRVFEPFFQAEQSIYREQGGVGLGLAICKGIIESQNGKIWIKSEKDKGTTFYFTIPRKPVKEIKPIKLLFSGEKNIESEIKKIFTEVMGPLGHEEFNTLKIRGITKKIILDYINDMTKKGIISKQKGKEFKNKIIKLYKK